MGAVPLVRAYGMATFIEMPKLSDTMKEGTLVRWHVREGDEVSVGDVIADVETDKATMEMEAFGAGILGKIYVPEGSKAPLGGILAVLVEEGETVPETPPAAGKAGVVRGAAPEASPSGVAREGGEKREVRRVEENLEAVPVAVPGGRVKASPLARKVAGGVGVDLATVVGSGPGGRIVRQDVEKAAAREGARRAAAPSGPGGATPVIRPSLEFDPGAKRVPLTGMRTIIAERLQISKSTIPHFYLNVELDAEPLMALRKEVNEGSGGHKLTVNDFVLKAVVMAAGDVPGVNCAWDVDAIVQYAAVNLAVAIAIPDGLVTPVVRHAEGKSLLEISQAVKDLAERARNKRLSPDQFAGGTLTVSNLGAYGIDSFDAIINPPQAVILSIGSIREVPVVLANGEMGIGKRMWVGMSCDHRVVDGAVGATYLQALRKYLESPALMMV